MSVADKDIIEECTQKLDKANAESYWKLEAYLLGQQPLNFLSEDVRKEVGNRLTPLHIDWPRLILRAHEERMDVEDFRLGNEESFDRAWDIWQRNNMDEGSQMVHFDALLFGRSFVSCWLKDGKAVMRPESAKQVWVEHDPGDGSVRHGIKRWFDKDRGHMLVITPDKVTKYVTKGKRDEGMDITNLPPDSWHPVPNGRRDNPTGRVPFFPAVYRGRIGHPYGESLLTEILPLADAVNKLATDMMTSSEYHAEPRRWATGVQVIENEDGELEETFTHKRGRTWTAEAPDARIGSLPEADLQNFISAIDMLTMHMMAVGGIPPHYADAAKGSLASAESIRASEASLVSSVRRACTAFGGMWEDAMRYCLELEGVKITPNIEKMETRWRDWENTTQNQIVDSAIKRKALEVPTYQLWEDMGYSKTQITRMKKMQKEEQDARAARAPDVRPGPEGPGGEAPVEDGERQEGVGAGVGDGGPRGGAPGVQ